MRILIFGLPGSGKTTLAKELAKSFSCLYLNGDKVREIFGDNDFSIAGRINQARRMKSLADMVQNVLVIADFVCPTKETRKIFNPDISVWMNTVSDCRYGNTTRIFESPSKSDFVIKSKNAKKYVVDIIERIKELQEGT